MSDFTLVDVVRCRQQAVAHSQVGVVVGVEMSAKRHIVPLSLQLSLSLRGALLPWLDGGGVHSPQARLIG